MLLDQKLGPGRCRAWSESKLFDTYQGHSYCYYCQLITSTYCLDPDQAGQIISGLDWIEAV